MSGNEFFEISKKMTISCTYLTHTDSRHPPGGTTLGPFGSGGVEAGRLVAVGGGRRDAGIWGGGNIREEGVAAVGWALSFS